MMSDSPNKSKPVMLTRGTLAVDCGKKFGADRPNANRASLTMREPNNRVQAMLKFWGLLTDDAPNPARFVLMNVFPAELFSLLFMEYRPVTMSRPPRKFLSIRADHPFCFVAFEAF